MSKYPIESSFLKQINKKEIRKITGQTTSLKCTYSEEKRNNLFYNYFEKFGHTIDHYYMLKWFPHNFKLAKLGRFQEGSSNNQAMTSEKTEIESMYDTNVLGKNITQE